MIKQKNSRTEIQNWNEAHFTTAALGPRDSFLKLSKYLFHAYKMDIIKYDYLKRTVHESKKATYLKLFVMGHIVWKQALCIFEDTDNSGLSHVWMVHTNKELIS